MTLPPRKYFSEISLGLHTRNAVAVPPNELMSGKSIPEDAQSLIDLCHIYLICKRPAFQIEPYSFEYSLPISSGVLVRRLAGKVEKHSFRFPLRCAEGGHVSVSEYPHRELIGYDAQGQEDRRWPASMLALRAAVIDRTINDFEVLYVGQAFGDGTRTAFDRLQSHSTLQKVLADTSYNNPDDEVLLFMFEYGPAVAFVSMDGRANDAELNEDEDWQHIQNVLDNPPNQRAEISIAEAGLIWYFRPKYNIKFKDSYPSSDLKTLEDCYNLDLAGIVVEINSEEFPARLWSTHRAPGHHHIAQFDLHDPEKRRTFFRAVFDQSAS